MSGRDSTNSFGVVQLCRNGIWYTLCYSSWNTHAANVVCRQLGYLEYGENILCTHAHNLYYKQHFFNIKAHFLGMFTVTQERPQIGSEWPVMEKNQQWPIVPCYSKPVTSGTTTRTMAGTMLLQLVVKVDNMNRSIKFLIVAITFSKLCQWRDKIGRWIHQ